MVGASPFRRPTISDDTRPDNVSAAPSVCECGFGMCLECGEQLRIGRAQRDVDVGVRDGDFVGFSAEPRRDTEQPRMFGDAPTAGRPWRMDTASGITGRPVNSRS